MPVPPTLLKCSINIRPSSNTGIRNFVLVLNPTILTVDHDNQVGPVTNHTTAKIGPMNLIIWNCRGYNGTDFRRNFSSIGRLVQITLVALIETKMQNHQVLLDDFSFTNMIEISSVENFSGMVILWD